MISKRVRAEAARIASVWASTPRGWQDPRWSLAATLLYLAAFKVAKRAPGLRDYECPYDADAHETAAEVEAMLRTGWTP